MPRYEYRCDANSRTIEVEHPMSEKLETWGQLAERAGEPLGNTPASTPIERLISLSFAKTSGSGSRSGPEFGGGGGCGPGCGCHPG